jgi:hypothetical protein
MEDGEALDRRSPRRSPVASMAASASVAVASTDMMAARDARSFARVASSLPAAVIATVVPVGHMADRPACVPRYEPCLLQCLSQTNGALYVDQDEAGRRDGRWEALRLVAATVSWAVSQFVRLRPRLTRVGLTDSAGRGVFATHSIAVGEVLHSMYG